MFYLINKEYKGRKIFDEIEICFVFLQSVILSKQHHDSSKYKGVQYQSEKVF